jgi:hypothetical protein
MGDILGETPCSCVVHFLLLLIEVDVVDGTFEDLGSCVDIQQRLGGEEGGTLGVEFGV